MRGTRGKALLLLPDDSKTNIYMQDSIICAHRMTAFFNCCSDFIFLHLCMVGVVGV